MSNNIPSETCPIIFFGGRLTTEQSLFALDLFQIIALLFQTGQDSSFMVAEIDREFDQLVGARHVFHSIDRADSHINLIERVE